METQAGVKRLGSRVIRLSRTGRGRPFRVAARPTGFTVLEILVSAGIVGLLASILLPAFMSAREAARATVCKSHLREIGVAMQNHHDSHGQLPPAWREARQAVEFGYGWASQLLPQLEQQQVHRALDFSDRPDRQRTPQGTGPWASSLSQMLCPSDIVEASFPLSADDEDEDQGDPDMRLLEQTMDATGSASRHLITLPTANYVGVFGTVEADDYQELGPAGYGDGSVIQDRRICFDDLQRGLSKTLLVGERKMATVPSTWLGVDLRGEDAACRLVGSAMTQPNCKVCDECEFTSRHPSGVIFLWADGHVTLLGDSVEPQLYRQFAQRMLP